jgi:hypothetical protein
MANEASPGAKPVEIELESSLAAKYRIPLSKPTRNSTGDSVPSFKEVIPPSRTQLISFPASRLNRRGNVTVVVRSCKVMSIWLRVFHVSRQFFLSIVVNRASCIFLGGLVGNFLAALMNIV